MSNIITGACHCGNVAYEISTETAPANITARACDCSFCRMHGAQTWSDATGTATIHVKISDALQTYRFGLKITDFLVCAICGAYVGAVIAEDDKLWSTLNLRLSDLNPATESASYGDEDAASRLTRRKQNWTPTICSAYRQH